LQPPGSGGRLGIIDFLRGVAIVEMVAAHYAGYFPPSFGKFVGYTETAMALFVLLAGFMVGRNYRRFDRDPSGQTRVVWTRALRVLLIQYVIILTAGVPLYLLGMPGVGTGQPLSAFLLQSLAFLNQIGLIHILPTFIPLFAISPAILFALAKGWDTPLLLISLALFGVGHFHPYILDLGQPTIFPFILFQLYFVVGCLLGKRETQTGALPPQRPRQWLIACGGLWLASMLLVHGKVIPSHLVSIHPLNLFGLMYQAPIIATLWTFCSAFWETVRRWWISPYVTRFGRHALLAFVLHLYLAKSLGVLNYFAPLPAMANYLLIAASVVAMNAIVRRYEVTQAAERPPTWSRAIQGLFR
jgi:hypothetical protein